MEKKLYASSLHAKLTKKSRKNTSNLSRALRKELKKASEISDHDIDYSDIPPLDFDKLGKPIVGKFYRPLKKAISIRMDTDVLAWFKSQSNKYQQLINKICRLYYLQHKKA